VQTRSHVWPDEISPHHGSSSGATWKGHARANHFMRSAVSVDPIARAPDCLTFFIQEQQVETDIETKLREPCDIPSPLAGWQGDYRGVRNHYIPKASTSRQPSTLFRVAVASRILLVCTLRLAGLEPLSRTMQPAASPDVDYLRHITPLRRHREFHRQRHPDSREV
jgi:hypothetical protein